MEKIKPDFEKEHREIKSGFQVRILKKGIPKSSHLFRVGCRGQKDPEKIRVGKQGRGRHGKNRPRNKRGIQTPKIRAVYKTPYRSRKTGMENDPTTGALYKGVCTGAYMRQDITTHHTGAAQRDKKKRQQSTQRAETREGSKPYTARLQRVR